MEVRDLYMTLDSTKMSGESLEDKGAAKQPLPFLTDKDIVIVTKTTWIISKSHTLLSSSLEFLYI